MYLNTSPQIFGGKSVPKKLIKLILCKFWYVQISRKSLFYHIIKYSLTENSTQQYCHVILIFFHKMANKRNVLKIISLCRLAMNLDLFKSIHIIWSTYVSQLYLGPEKCNRTLPSQYSNFWYACFGNKWLDYFHLWFFAHS